MKSCSSCGIVLNLQWWNWIGLSNPFILTFFPHCNEGFTPQPHINFCVGVRRRYVSELIPAEVLIFNGHMGTQIVSSSEVPSILASNENKHGFYPPKTSCGQNSKVEQNQQNHWVVLRASVNRASWHSMGHVTTVAPGNITSVAMPSADGILPFVSVWDEDYLRFLRNVH